MVVPRGTAARREAEESALLELEAALAACLPPPPSSEPLTVKRPEPPRAFGRTLVMAPAPPLPVPMATTLTLNGPPPWELPPLVLETFEVPAVVPVAPVRSRSRTSWLAVLVVLLAVSGTLAVHPLLRARTRSVLVVAGARIAKIAVTTKDHARRALHR